MGDDSNSSGEPRQLSDGNPDDHQHTQDKAGWARGAKGGNKRRLPKGTKRYFSARLAAVSLAIAIAWAIWPKDGSAPFPASLRSTLSTPLWTSGPSDHKGPGGDGPDSQSEKQLYQVRLCLKSSRTHSRFLNFETIRSD
eukprot:scaffold12562_cov43-Prasinocladus_malaysianus.AAC.1